MVQTTSALLRADAGLFAHIPGGRHVCVSHGEAALAVGDVAMAGALVDLCDGAETRPDDAWAVGALRREMDVACGRLREARSAYEPPTRLARELDI